MTVRPRSFVALDTRRRVHVLIYQIKDAKLALSFAHFDTAGGSQMRYYGCALMAVQKPNHLWETIFSQNLQPR
jgi:hypothetical protein